MLRAERGLGHKRSATCPSLMCSVGDSSKSRSNCSGNKREMIRKRNAAFGGRRKAVQWEWLEPKPLVYADGTEYFRRLAYLACGLK